MPAVSRLLAEEVARRSWLGSYELVSLADAAINAQHNTVGFCLPVRLEKDNPHVKLKCLKIIKHAAQLHRSAELQVYAHQ